MRLRAAARAGRGRRRCGGGDDAGRRRCPGHVVRRLLPHAASRRPRRGRGLDMIVAVAHRVVRAAAAERQCDLAPSGARGAHLAGEGEGCGSAVRAGLGRWAAGLGPEARTSDMMRSSSSSVQSPPTACPPAATAPAATHASAASGGAACRCCRFPPRASACAEPPLSAEPDDVSRARFAPRCGSLGRER